MFIVMTNKILAYKQKPKKLWKFSKLITNSTNKENPENVKQFPKKPWSKI